MKTKRLLISSLCLFAVSAVAAAGQVADTAQVSEGTRWLESPRSGLAIKMLVERSNLGSGEVELGEITFPAGSEPTSGHTHGSTEIFYVLEGVLMHVVNGREYRLTPGMVGIVRPGDEVMHAVPGDAPVKALVIWAPGGEAARIAPGFRERPVGPAR